MSEIVIRPAKTQDVPAIRALVGPLVEQRVLMPKEIVAYFEGIQEFLLAAEVPDVTPSAQVSSAETLGSEALQAETLETTTSETVISKTTTSEAATLQDHTLETIIGCGALHVMWEDLAEIRTLAAHPDWLGKGVGHQLVSALLDRARALGVKRVFCLTFEVEFFERQGFSVMADQSSLAPEVYMELLRSHDEGVAEFLDLARVKPNTLGNTRMIRVL